MKQLIELAESKGYKTWFVVCRDLVDNGNYIELCLIQKWLMEEYGIWVEVLRHDNYFLYSFKLKKEIYEGVFDKLVEALEEGIKKSLELI